MEGLGQTREIPIQKHGSSDSKKEVLVDTLKQLLTANLLLLFVPKDFRENNLEQNTLYSNLQLIIKDHIRPNINM